MSSDVSAYAIILATLINFARIIAYAGTSEDSAAILSARSRPTHPCAHEGSAGIWRFLSRKVSAVILTGMMQGEVASM